MATWKMLLLQDSASYLMEQLNFFHDHTLMILFMITIFVTYILSSLFTNKYINRFLLDNQIIELIWTIMPSIILIFIALPSLKLIYILDEINNPAISIKSMGHQWYWSYEYTDFINIEFDSYMTKDLEMFNFRLLETDNRMIIPFQTNVRLLTSSNDVIHSWTIPSIGVKIDASPGRLNQMMFNINRTGLLFGQCSEICGANHSFMPITLESISPKYFLKWMNKF
uniref:Cytochrome c oxidase subunit 2 n=1 Tax=Discolomatinae sp. GENSP01 TaxID=1205622 RepID=A0A0S2MNR4_9CUCU|nr:cytochrome c oxidase subunit 2 [Discolomatinae sp. GENSP01]